ncbi:hypothetical protein [Pseudonocardia sp. ICBG601]|uniref:hypothetical protein n=1 Tax=Pseudonocardia sp. ICBG601 TaxID=2846759 RepID=UPI001CF68D8B|nr:hypothetical protein [Pseudonocardia sp. ICBG601]
MQLNEQVREVIGDPIQPTFDVRGQRLCGWKSSPGSPHGQRSALLRHGHLEFVLARKRSRRCCAAP